VPRGAAIERTRSSIEAPARARPPGLRPPRRRNSLSRRPQLAASSSSQHFWLFFSTSAARLTHAFPLAPLSFRPRATVGASASLTPCLVLPRASREGGVVAPRTGLRSFRPHSFRALGARDPTPGRVEDRAAHALRPAPSGHRATVTRRRSPRPPPRDPPR
jgi:hypothetical protein